jgi:hypothetical protein
MHQAELSVHNQMYIRSQMEKEEKTTCHCRCLPSSLKLTLPVPRKYSRSGLASPGRNEARWQKGSNVMDKDKEKQKKTNKNKVISDQSRSFVTKT